VARGLRGRSAGATTGRAGCRLVARGRGPGCARRRQGCGPRCVRVAVEPAPGGHLDERRDAIVRRGVGGIRLASRSSVGSPGDAAVSALEPGDGRHGARPRAHRARRARRPAWRVIGAGARLTSCR
jgi:hypothetical protein